MTEDNEDFLIRLDVEGNEVDAEGNKVGVIEIKEKKTKLDKKLLKALDSILCCGFMGDELIAYSDSYLEVPITEDDAKILQEFHDIVNDDESDKGEKDD